jgi:hypothetical protein
MIDVVGEKHQQRRVMVVALFTGDLVNTNSRKIDQLHVNDKQN